MNVYSITLVPIIINFVLSHWFFLVDENINVYTHRIYYKQWVSIALGVIKWKKKFFKFYKNFFNDLISGNIRKLSSEANPRYKDQLKRIPWTIN